MAKRIGISFLVALSLIWGIWCGEDLRSFLGVSTIAIIGASVFILAGLVIQGTALHRFSLEVLISAVLIAGHYIGRQRATMAFNECIASGESVRQVLADHRRQHGSFPQLLSQLDYPLPGQRFFRGSLFNYRCIDNDYEISFRDWLVSHRATATEPFIAHK
jgi:hypothetical protein